MENNCESFGFNQNAYFTSDFLGFHEGSGDLVNTPCPTVSHHDESQNNFFMNSSLENHDFPARFGDLTITPFHEGQNGPLIKSSHGILTEFQDLTSTHPIAQQINMGGNATDMSHAKFNGITFTCTSSGQNSVPFMPSSLEVWGVTNHIGSSSDSLNNHRNTSNISRNIFKSANKVNRSSSNRQCKKRIRFRFVTWTYHEKKVMDQQLQKCAFLSVLKISKKIQALLPNKSIRDVAMRIKWLIKHEKSKNIWEWEEPSTEGDLSEFNFYVPDDPNDPDLLAIRNRFSPQAVKRSRV